jgi:3-hydroxyethyl bacteriochlorophyllide a dehydrogenase
VGQLAARLAQQRGAWVAAADLNEQRLRRASADLLVNVDKTALEEAVGEPVTTIVEAAGSMEALAGALPLLAPGGAILLLGYYEELRLPYMPLFLKEARLLTAREWAPGDLQRSRDLMATGQLDVSPLLTHERPIGDVADAYDQALNDLDCLKLVLKWNGV